MKKNIAIFYGGKSCEHEVSIITALQAANAAKAFFNVHLVYMAQSGAWLTGEPLWNIETYTKDNYEIKGVKRCLLNSGALYEIKKNKKLKIVSDIACVVNCCHGGEGEGGELAGLFRLINMPHTSCDSLPAALCLNKQMFKMWAKSNGFAQIKYFAFTKESKIKDVAFPCIVKPNSLGSSIGIAKCNNKQELKQALDTAFCLDNVVLCEKCVEDITEINVSAYSTKGNIYVSDCEQPIVTAGNILDFNEKYLNGGKKVGMDNISRYLPAKVDEVYTKQAREIARTVYEKLGLSGVVRADFIIDNAEKKLYLNEINTIPGSLSFYIWQHHGIPFANLIERLVESAIERNSINNKKHTFESNILKQYKVASKKTPAKC